MLDIYALRDRDWHAWAYAMGTYQVIKRSPSYRERPRFPSRESKYIQHAGVDEVVSELVETLRLARAVLLYFVEMVAIREHRGHRDDVVRVPLVLPDHDWVHGGEGA